MELITDVAGLKQRITFLEQRQNYEKNEIVAEFTEFKKSLTPGAMIRKIIGSIRKSPEVQADILHGAVGMASGFLTNKVLLGPVKGPLKTILGAIVQFGMTNIAVKYPDTIKTKVISFMTNFLQSIKIKPDGGDDNFHRTDSHLAR